MERKIGEIFEHNGDLYQVVECSEDNYPCIGCCGCKGVGGARINGGECNGNARNDRKFVMFKKLEKVGEPYKHYEKLYQCYKLPMETEIRLLPDNCYPIGKDNLVEIEIKEDMEENKTTFPKEDNALTRTVYAYVNGGISDKELIRSIKEMSDEYPYNKNNLEPFSLEAARAGKPVCTREGRKARIICFDKQGGSPIIALVETFVVEYDCIREETYYYTIDGLAIGQNAESKDDLMMLPEKREGWINVKKDASLFKSREEAERNCTKDYASVRVEFEI